MVHYRSWVQWRSIHTCWPTKLTGSREMWKWFYKHDFQTHFRDWYLNTLRPRQNGRRFADDTFKRIFLNENVRISIKISLKFVPKGPINNIPSLVQIMAWRRSGDKPLSEPMMVSLPTHICVTWPQWVKHLLRNSSQSNATKNVAIQKI